MTMSENSTLPFCGETVLPSMLSAEDFPARISAPSALAPGLTEMKADSGPNTPGSLANFDPATSSWRTSQLCLFGGLAEFSETWPRSGTMRSGSVFRRAQWLPHTHGTECGLWLTPTSNDRKPASQGEMDMMKRRMRGEVVKETYIRLRSQLAATEDRRLPPNPRWIEWLMGFPTGWTLLQRSATVCCPKSQNSLAEPSSLPDEVTP